MSQDVQDSEKNFTLDWIGKEGKETCITDDVEEGATEVERLADTGWTVVVTSRDILKCLKIQECLMMSSVYDGFIMNKIDPTPGVPGVRLIYTKDPAFVKEGEADIDYDYHVKVFVEDDETGVVKKVYENLHPYWELEDIFGTSGTSIICRTDYSLRQLARKLEVDVYEWTWLFYDEVEELSIFNLSVKDIVINLWKPGTFPNGFCKNG